MRVSQNIVSSLLMYAETRGQSRAQVLEAAAIDPALLNGSDERIPARALYAVHRAIERLLGNDTWALEIAEALPKGSYGVAEYIFRSQNTLEESLRAVVRYFSLLSEITELRLAQSSRGIVLEATHLDPEIRGSVHRTLYQNLLSAILHLAREITGEHLVPERVEFPFAAPSDLTKYSQVFGVAPQFDSETATMYFDHVAASTSVMGADPNLSGILERHADQLLSRKLGDSEFLVSVRKVVLKQLHGGDTSLETIARQLSMSNRSVQRRLGESGLTFKEVLSEMRYTLARQCLEESRFSVDEIAFLLGYSDNSAFVKAFKRWSRVTPGQYRARHVEQQR